MDAPNKVVLGWVQISLRKGSLRELGAGMCRSSDVISPELRDQASSNYPQFNSAA
ncbi:hypothetical protein PanWU01x14_293540, partial [Parasponia andersonii]